MKYGFIQEHQAEFSIARMCKCLGVSRSGFYAYWHHTRSNRERSNQQLDKNIEALYMKHKKRYGAPRITKALQTKGIPCSHTRVARRMRFMGLYAVAKKKFKVTTDSNHSNPVFNNILNRDFATTGINQKWVSDITFIPTDEGWLYCAVVIDVHSRAVIGWAMSHRIKKTISM